MITLTPFTKDDFSRFISWVDTASFMYQFAGPIFSFPITEEQLNNYLNVRNRRIYNIIDSNRNPIGHCEINNIDLKNKNARLCRILIAKKEDRNKGYGSKIIELLLAICFNDLQLHRVDLGVFEFNIGAIKCYQKCGFTIEGLMRDSFIIDGHFESTYNMSILKPEWEKDNNLF